MASTPSHELPAKASSPHEVEERLRAVLDTVIDAIITIDQRGTIVDANPATERIFGYDRSEMIGQNVKMLMPSPYREEHDEYLARYARTGEARIIGIGRELIAQRKDGATFPIDLAISEIDHLHLFTGIVRDISERKRLEREILATADEEQRRIGQDIHDGVGQELTGIGLFAQTLRETLEDDPSVAELAEKITTGLRRVQNQIRAVSRGLAPVSIEAGGLPSALENLAESMSETGQIGCTCTCNEPPPQFDPQTANHLYRMAQEAVANALRHGRATQVNIALRHGSKRWVLEITDNGIGCEPQDENGIGMGLRTMRYRAGLIGGLLTIEPTPGGGTHVSCMLPEEPTV